MLANGFMIMKSLGMRSSEMRDSFSEKPIQILLVDDWEILFILIPLICALGFGHQEVVT